MELIVVYNGREFSENAEEYGITIEMTDSQILEAAQPLLKERGIEDNFPLSVKRINATQTVVGESGIEETETQKIYIFPVPENGR